jgi:hypothetical protein
MHGRSQLLQRYLIVYERSCKGEIGIVRPVSPHDIHVFQTDQIIVCQPFGTSAHERCGETDPPVIHKQGEPVEKMIVSGVKIKNIQSFCIQLIGIDISVRSFRDCPFPCQSRILCTVKASAIVIVRPARRQVRRFNDLPGPVVKCDKFHDQ